MTLCLNSSSRISENQIWSSTITTTKRHRLAGLVELLWLWLLVLLLLMAMLHLKTTDATIRTRLIRILSAHFFWDLNRRKPTSTTEGVKDTQGSADRI